MAPEVSTQRELQDQSIKARKHELFVDESAEFGPHKAFREYLKETPADPLSKNVKLMLWGAAAPVVFLFLAAMLTGARSAPPKPPEEPLHSLVGTHHAPPPHPVVANRSDKPAGPSVGKPGGDKPGGSAAGSKPPTEKKSKKKNNNKKKTSKPKAVAKKPPEVAKADGDEAKKDSGSSPDGQGQAKDPKVDSEKGKAGKAGASKKSTSKTPTPPRSTGPSFFKKKKAPVYQYPKDQAEKKGESNNSSDNPLPGLIP